MMQEPIDTIRVLAKRPWAGKSAIAFAQGFRDGLASVVFPAGAQQVHIASGSPRTDRERILAMRAMLIAKRRAARGRQRAARVALRQLVP